MEVSFEEDRIHFLRYDFPGASVHPTGTLTPAQIRDVDWKMPPPEIRTKGGETLFVPRDLRPDLERFCGRHAIARQVRPYIWADLLEPFLDTRFDPADERATVDRLGAAGVPVEEVAGIRRRLTPLMEAYNFDSMLWEWAFLGLFDLLKAATGPLVRPALQATLGDPALFYAWAMEIAERRR